MSKKRRVASKYRWTARLRESDRLVCHLTSTQALEAAKILETSHRGLEIKYYFGRWCVYGKKR